MATERNPATEAENKPVYHVIVVAVNMRSNMTVDMRTHEDKDTISALLPAIGHVLIFFLCNL